METILPIIACVIGIIVLGGATLWNNRNKNKRSSNSNKASVGEKSIHSLINIRDIRDSFLYTNDNKICAYFKVDPISVDLYSQREKKALCQLLSSQLASEQRPFKFLAVSRPVDISPLISDYSQIWSSTDNSVVRDILSNEMTVMMNYAHSGEVVQRQFYFMLWEDWKPGIESDLLKRINEFRNKFITCRLTGDVLKQQEIVRLCNLVNNPAYSAVEDMEFDANITTIIDLYGNRDEYEGGELVG
ncbi:hypothetical protein [Acetobacterium sp.]|uniref:hypothetical protein n=1 Tax=Acetobacterium sp. TaxID=1872094 RepID=UPI002F40BB23